MKRHGINQKEIKLNSYEFIGNFENDKRISGKIIYFNVNPINHVKILEIEDLKRLKSDEKTRLKFTFDFNGKNFFYKGSIINKKLCDENASVGYYNLSEFPKYQGKVENNSKNGIATYYWNDHDYYHGPFLKNKMDSGLDESRFDTNKFKNQELNQIDESIGFLHKGDKNYKVVYIKGELVAMKEDFTNALIPLFELN